MNLKMLLQNLAPKAYGDLAVDGTVGGVGFDPAKLVWQGVRAKVVRCTLEGGEIRAKEVGAPTAVSGDRLSDGDEFFVAGTEAINNWRAIRTGTVSGTIRYHVYF